MVDIEVSLVRRLVAAQFPQWADLPVTPVAQSGWDNRTFHLGDTMSVRLPSAERYVAQVEKEHRFLPALGPHLPLPIPAPLGLVEPGEVHSGYIVVRGAEAGVGRLRWSVRELQGKGREVVFDETVHIPQH